MFGVFWGGIKDYKVFLGGGGINDYKVFLVLHLKKTATSEERGVYMKLSCV